MLDRPTRDDFINLWNNANDHSVIMRGCWIDEQHEGDTAPPPPSDREIIKKVTEYFKAFN